MTLKTLCVCGALLACGSARTPDPLPPANPIEIQSEIGVVGSQQHRNTRVEVNVLISSKGADADISLHTYEWGKLAPSVAEDVAAGLEQAAEASSAGKPFTTTVGPYGQGIEIVAKRDDDGRMEISFQIPGSRRQVNFSGRPHPVSVMTDPDNAPTLAKLIRRANANIAWLTPRLKDLDLSKP